MQEHLLQLYIDGRVDEIVQHILPGPDASFDALTSDDPLFPYILNYFDASFFKTYMQTLYACECLTFLIEQIPDKRPYHAQAWQRLEYEQRVLRTLLTEFSLPEDALFKLLDKERRGRMPSGAELAEVRSAVPEEYRQLLETQRVLGQGWLRYQQHKGAHATILKDADHGFSRPWLAIRYACQSAISQLKLSAAIPIVFFEPLEIDYAPLLEPLHDRSALFVFESRAKLIQLLQFPAVAESLCMPHHLVYVMEVYPNSQFAVQDCALLQGQNFEVFFLVDRPLLRSAQPLLQDAMRECLQQESAELEKETSTGNWLYQVAQRILFSFEEERLGVNRAMALHEYLSGKRWHDPHKGIAPADKSLGRAPIDYQRVKLSLLAEQRVPRSTANREKIKLVHIVPQIVDDGHAPSRLLENLAACHDREHFEVHVVSTERLQFHWLEYPYNLYNSESSLERAPRRIKALQQHACYVHILDGIPGYESTANQMVQFMRKIAADVAVFHGPDVINNMAAQMTDVPLRVLFDHGALPAYAGYDLVLASTPVTLQKYLDQFRQWKTQVRELPFAVDVKNGWLPQPFAAENWGVPADGLMMTTISQHLDNRLGGEMLLAIAEILQRIPKAYYVPIGKVDGTDKFIGFFKQHKVDDRVIFMGQVDRPSQYARSMHLYLNEFPFGSGLGILDAMASGCPVVSMYDPDGPPQARYGAQYMGVDWVVVSGKRSDYVDLACRLLSDRDLYQEWSAQALSQYEKYADVKGYVKAFEEIILLSL